MISRQEVFEHVNDEREYQDAKWPLPAHLHSMTEFAVYIENYITEIFRIVSITDETVTHDQIMERFRKIAALAVAAMEQHGTPPRQPAIAAKVIPFLSAFTVVKGEENAA